MEAIIFVGLQASGKSTFYRERFANTHVRINLDMLHHRWREDAFLKTCIETKQRFVVDNTNLSVAERQKYIELAKANHFKVIGYYFQSKVSDCLERNAQRTGKACIPRVGILGAVKRLQRPTLAEGFDELNHVHIDGTQFVIQPWVERPVAAVR